LDICERNSNLQKEKMNKILERQSNIYLLYKTKVLDYETKKQANMEKIIDSNRLISQEKEKQLITETSKLMVESRNMHKKILELQILDKNKRISLSRKKIY
jgi:hypothetical protein